MDFSSTVWCTEVSYCGAEPLDGALQLTNAKPTSLLAQSPLNKNNGGAKEAHRLGM